MHRSGSTSPNPPKREMKSNKPIKGSVWQTDEGEINLIDKDVHAHNKY